MLLNKIKLLCKQQNLTISGLERKAGLSNGVISKWDTSSPSIDKVVLVAKALNTTLNDLMDQSSQLPITNRVYPIAQKLERLDEEQLSVILQLTQLLHPKD